MHAAMGTKDQDIEMLVRKLRERFERYPLPIFSSYKGLQPLNTLLWFLAENNNLSAGAQTRKQICMTWPRGRALSVNSITELSFGQLQQQLN